MTAAIPIPTAIIMIRTVVVQLTVSDANISPASRWGSGLTVRFERGRYTERGKGVDNGNQCQHNFINPWG